ncbi:unnamed protein product [Amoebophrya sp. A25]|nr:unnamed protein product [Amoebophrya sp. A25]|eukprot:GSA25T00011488001.1
MLRSKPSTHDLLAEGEKGELEEWIQTRAPPVCRGDLLKYGPGHAETIFPKDAMNGGKEARIVGSSLAGGGDIVSAKLYRNDYLAWCGTVEVAEAHPWYGLRLSEVEQRLSRSPHGGLSDGVSLGKKPIFGFDCNHRGDFVPYAAFVNDKKAPPVPSNWSLEEKMKDVKMKISGRTSASCSSSSDEQQPDLLQYESLKKLGDSDPEKMEEKQPAIPARISITAASPRPQLQPQQGSLSLMMSGQPVAGLGTSLGAIPPMGLPPAGGIPQMGLPPGGGIPQMGIPEEHRQNAGCGTGGPATENRRRLNVQQNTDWNPVLLTTGVYRDYAFARNELELLLRDFVIAEHA